MRYVCLLMSWTMGAILLHAQDGGALYKERCASCHDTAAARVPSITAIKAMSGEAIYRALTTGVMKTQGAGLSTGQLFALIGHIGPTGGTTQPAAGPPTGMCQADAPLQTRAPQWSGWSPSVTNSRFQSAEAGGLTAAAVPKLKLKWAFHLGDVTEARSQPAAAWGRVFIGSMTGTVSAVDAESGCTRWVFRAGAGIRGGISAGESKGVAAVFFGDTGATLYAVNAKTGELLWKVRPADHYATMATATPRYYKGVIYQGFASFEEAIAGDPKFQCCTFRGSVAALDAGTGATLWHTYTIADSAKPTGKTAVGTQQLGPSGAAVWSTPTVDEQLGVLYVATGDNYSHPATSTSDAVLAMDMKTGKILWTAQLTENDVYNNACGLPIPGNCPEAHGRDSDFGQPPILVTINPGGKRLLVIAQKSGVVHAIDPDQKGKTVWQKRVGEGGELGGSQWGSAFDGERIYVAISDIRLSGVADPKSPKGYRLVLNPKKGGGLHALNVRTGEVVWSAAATDCEATRTDCSPAQSAAVSAVPGLVFSGAVDGHMRGYATGTGKVIWDVDTAREFDTVNGKAAHGGSIDAAGPVVAEGMVFFNAGYGQWGGMPGNVLLAYSIR